MKVIGLIGGVGAGKSRILEILREEYGAETILADEVAHRLMEPGQEGYERVVSAFGTSFLKPEGGIDKPKLAELIFHDGSVLERMNHIVHPLAWAEIEAKIREVRSGLAVVETALPDQEHRDIFDEIWYVYTSEENRFKRLSAGRGYTAGKTRSIMDSQMPDTEFRSYCDRVIDNNGSVDEVRAQIAAILQSEGCRVQR